MAEEAPTSIAIPSTLTSDRDGNEDHLGAATRTMCQDLHVVGLTAVVRQPVQEWASGESRHACGQGREQSETPGWPPSESNP